MRSAHVGLAIFLLLLPGCNRAKRAKCETTLVEWWGREAAEDKTYRNGFMDWCVKMPEDLLDCLRLNTTRHSNGQPMDSACEAEVRRYNKSRGIDPVARMRAALHPVDAAAGR